MHDADGLVIAVRALRADVEEQIHFRRCHQLDGIGAGEARDVHALRDASHGQHVYGVFAVLARLRHFDSIRFLRLRAKKLRSSSAHSYTQRSTRA